jgi:hypothetical protein
MRIGGGWNHLRVEELLVITPCLWFSDVLKDCTASNFRIQGKAVSANFYQNARLRIPQDIILNITVTRFQILTYIRNISIDGLCV